MKVKILKRALLALAVVALLTLASPGSLLTADAQVGHCPDGWTAHANGICTPNDVQAEIPFDNTIIVVLFDNDLDARCPDGWTAHANGICTPEDLQTEIPFDNSIGLFILLLDANGPCPDGWTPHANGICTPDDFMMEIPFDFNGVQLGLLNLGPQGFGAWVIRETNDDCEGEIRESGEVDPQAMPPYLALIAADLQPGAYCLVAQGVGPNNGFSIEAQFSVVVTFSKDDCKKGGWVNFVDAAGNRIFKNQGDCVSFFSTDGKNEPGKNIPNPKA